MERKENDKENDSYVSFHGGNYKNIYIYNKKFSKFYRFLNFLVLV